MASADEFYVYAYLRKSNNLPYYIGKGQEKRCVQKHYGISVPKDRNKIVFLERNLSEVGALALERRYISWYGRKDKSNGILLNKTDGGDGVSGYKHTEKTKKLLSVVSKSKGNSGQKMSDKSKAKMSLAKLGHTPWNKNKTTNQVAWNKNKKFMSKSNLQRMNTLSITDPTGVVYYVKNLSEFCRIHNLNQGAMSHVSHGKAEHHKQWTCNFLKENNFGNS